MPLANKINVGPVHTAELQSFLFACSFSLQINKIYQSTEHQITEHQITEHQITAEHIPVKSVGCLTKDTVPIKTTLTNTFSFPVKVNTPEPSAQEGREPPLTSLNSKASL